MLSLNLATRKEKLDFFIEKMLQKHPLRNQSATFQIYRDKSMGNNYVVEEYMRKKKKINLDDIVNMMNPNAKIAKAKLRVKGINQKEKQEIRNTEKPVFHSADQITKFLVELNMEKKKKKKKKLYDSESTISEEEENDRDGNNNTDNKLDPENVFPLNQENEEERELRDTIVQKMNCDSEMIDIYTRLTRINQLDIINSKENCFKDLKSSIQKNKDINIEEKYIITPETVITFFLKANLDPLSFIGCEGVNIPMWNKEEVVLRHFDEHVVDRVIGINEVKKNSHLNHLLQSKRLEQKQMAEKALQRRLEREKLREIKKEDHMLKRKMMKMQQNGETAKDIEDLNLIKGIIKKKKKSVFDYTLPNYAKIMSKQSSPLLKKITQMTDNLTQRRIHSQKHFKQYSHPKKVDNLEVNSATKSINEQLSNVFDSKVLVNRYPTCF